MYNVSLNKYIFRNTLLPTIFLDFDTVFEKCRDGFQYPAFQLLDSSRKYIKEQK